MTPSQKTSARKPSEILIAPLSLLEQRLEKLSVLPERLTPDSLALWESLRSDLKRTDAVCGSRLHFNDGTVLAVVFVSPKASSFELQTELRRAISDLFSETTHPRVSGGLVVNLKALDRKLAARAATAIAALSTMAGWKPVSFGQKAKAKSSGRESGEVRIDWRSRLPARQLEQCTEKGKRLGQANNLVRTLADLPSNELNPASYRSRAQEFARENKLSFEFWSLADLEKQKAGAFLAVNRADPKSAAGIALIKYKPRRSGKMAGRGARKIPVVALVGKGLCFDTGGYNIKTGNYMLGMHGDMTGSALALALCGYFAQMEAPFEVHAYLALAENLISPTAYKPNDVVIACDGTSIEVVDTDAEGRMVLSDTLALVRRTKPSLCIDFATLTGAAIRSLDTRRSAVFSNSSKLARLAVEAGDESGERTWSFPIGGDYREVLKSRIADLVQCAPVNNADHIYAATFLSHFIGDETPWVHVDLVAAENKGGLGLAASDTTGFGVFWTDAFVTKAIKGGK
jgi:leucyl aminopeptidase